MDILGYQDIHLLCYHMSLAYKCENKTVGMWLFILPL